MKTFLSFSLSIVIVATMLTGCGLLHKNVGIFGKASKTQEQAKAEYQSVNEDLAKKNIERLTHIGAWAQGVEHSLDASTNKTDPAVTTAQTINKRVEELANKPDLEELKQVYKIVENLLTNQVVGQKLLEKKDKEIVQLQNSINELNQDKEDAIKKYASIAEANAAKADQYSATLKQLDSGWGLAAVWYGLKKFVTHIAIGLGIFMVLFFVLRMLAASNPIAGSIFSIFEVAASWLINSLKSIFPKSVDFSKLVPTHISDGYKATLKNVMDEVLLLEHQQKTNPTVSNITLDQLVVNIEKNLNDQDKVNVEEIKRELNWS